MWMYMAEWLTPWTPDLEVQGSSLAHRLVSLNKGGGVTLQWTSILPF